MTRRTSSGRPGRAIATTPQIPPVQFEHQPELRALMMFPTIPPGHMTFLVPDDRFHPHLRRGEFAVVDLSDHQPAQGELFLISYTSPRVECGMVFELCQMRARTEFRRSGGAWLARPEEGADRDVLWTACHWIPPDDPRDREAALRAGNVGTSEGPFTTEYAAEKLVGRVVGVWVPGRGSDARAELWLPHHSNHTSTTPAGRTHPVFRSRKVTMGHGNSKPALGQKLGH